MAKIGDYRYPDDLDPDEAEEFLDILVNEFGGAAENREAFAQAAGHKSKDSGAFNRKVADARKYDLITPRGDYEATELGFRLANPRDEADLREAKFEMLQNIELLADLHGELNGNTPPDQFWRVLNEITDTNPKEARDAADRIEELYRTMLRAEIDQNQKQDSEEGTEESAPENRKQASTPEQTEDAHERKPQDGEIYVRVENDEMRFDDLTDVNLRLAQQFLQSKMESDNSEGGSGGVQMRFS